MGGLRVAVVRRKSWVKYQLAIVKRPRGWRPRRWDASPPKAKVLGVLRVSGTARDVELLVRDFNRSTRSIWAVSMVEARNTVARPRRIAAGLSLYPYRPS
ncbi:MAG: hypothetical protein ACLQNE_46890 [Thermoguttaceae bacterium]|jgi:hypothetical protein